MIFHCVQLLEKRKVLDIVCNDVDVGDIIEVSVSSHTQEVPAVNARKCMALLVGRKIVLCRVHSAWALDTP